MRTTTGSKSTRSRVPGTKAKKSAAIPVCSSHLTTEYMRRDADGKWYCARCADEWLGPVVESRLRRKSQGGVILPEGVKDERRKTPSFQDIYPNRQARRHAR